MILMCAPLQGLTEAVWRHWHADLCGGADEYFTPFIRMEDGQPRRRDLRDATSALNANHRLTPQVLAADAGEFAILAAGHPAVDLNAGCPFPPQTRRGRGAALIARPEALESIAEVMHAMPATSFSLKMRLGLDSPDQWRRCVKIINSMPLRHVTVHPRTAAQQYGGQTDAAAFAALAAELAHPVVWNGDIASPADISRLCERFPHLHGVMCGRGLLARPTLFSEWRAGAEATAPQLTQAVRRLHDMILGDMRRQLCGDAQVLSKIRPMWEYWQHAVGRKSAKAVLKARTMRGYLDAATAAFAATP